MTAPNTKRRWKPNCNIVHHLPQEVIEEILSWVAVKCLMRFKSVSKSWNGLISSPSLANMHRKRQRQRGTLQQISHMILTSTPCGLSVLRSSQWQSSSSSQLLDFFPVSSGRSRVVRMLGSCHGLVALALDNDQDFFLWNPSTGEYNKLPPPPPPSSYVPWVKDDEKKQVWISGLGYDDADDDYKVFVGIGKSGFDSLIFSVRSNSWRAIALPSPPAHAQDGGPLHRSISLFLNLLNGLRFRRGAGCLLNGALHWVHCENPIRGIVSVDLKRERYDIVETPRDHHDLTPPHHVFPLCDVGVIDETLLCLLFSRYDSGRPASPIPPPELWVMKEYGVKESWTKLLTFPDNEIIPTYRLLPFLCTSNHHQITVFVGSNKELIRYEYHDHDHDHDLDLDHHAYNNNNQQQQQLITTEKFQICKCDIRPCHCQAIVCEHSLYFPSDMFGTSTSTCGRREEESYPLSHFFRPYP